MNSQVQRFQKKERFREEESDSRREARPQRYERWLDEKEDRQRGLIRKKEDTDDLQYGRSQLAHVIFYPFIFFKVIGLMDFISRSPLGFLFKTDTKRNMAKYIDMIFYIAHPI